MSSIKLVCVDVDGTLVSDDKSIPQGNLKAIKEASYRGVAFAVLSGRISPSIQHYQKLLGIKGPVSSLGGCILEDQNLNIIEEYNLDRETCLKIFEARRESGISLLFYHHNRWFTDRDTDPRWIKSEYGATGVKGELTDSLEDLLSSFLPNKFLALDIEIPKVEYFYKLLSASAPDTVKAFFSWPQFLEVVPPQADKGQAVKSLRRYYNLKKEEVMVCGDYFNDTQMFSEAGISVAMANSPQGVKDLATYVTKNDNNNCGVAEAIEKFVL
ncbi:MAG: Cof-type HAD-IIB family hydrolase [Sphaerochaetaceae bacterium]|nr:Cof-type HAD-IIB family hydrolase [Sphaerochaetaceae bacterium]